MAHRSTVPLGSSSIDEYDVSVRDPVLFDNCFIRYCFEVKFVKELVFSLFGQ